MSGDLALPLMVPAPRTPAAAGNVGILDRKPAAHRPVAKIDHRPVQMQGHLLRGHQCDAVLLIAGVDLRIETVIESQAVLQAGAARQGRLCVRRPPVPPFAPPCTLISPAAVSVKTIAIGHQGAVIVAKRATHRIEVAATIHHPSSYRGGTRPPREPPHTLESGLWARTGNCRRLLAPAIDDRRTL